MHTAISEHARADSIWLVDIGGIQFRWSIWADDYGIEIHVQFLDEGGTLLVIKGLVYDPLPADWRQGERFTGDVRFTSLPDKKVEELVKLALARGWRHDMDEQIFWL